MSLTDYRFCPRCRSPLTVRGEVENPHTYCAACGFAKWDNPLPATIGVIRDGSKVLLVRRARAPEPGRWDAVGGFLGPGEAAEDCLLREAREEIGVELVLGPCLGTFAATYGADGPGTLGIAFLATLAPGAEIRLSEENDAHGWFELTGLPPIAFADVRAALTRATRPPA